MVVAPLSPSTSLAAALPVFYSVKASSQMAHPHNQSTVHLTELDGAGRNRKAFLPWLTNVTAVQ